MASPDHDPAELQRLTRQYRDYARHEMMSHGSPIYSAICSGLAGDPQTGSLALFARPGFGTPLILLAAVHHLLLDGVGHPLGAYYPSVAGEAARPIDDGLYPAFADLVATHRAAVEDLVASRTTQTNEAGRAVIVVPALGLIAAASDAPIALLEVGASAGLNLNLDRFGYVIGGRATGDPASPVQIRAEVRGELAPPVPAAVPRPSWRAGLDLSPLDVRDPATVGWLRALVWPEHVDRMAILDAAVGVAHAHPPRLVRGDLVDDLPALAGQAPSGSPLVVTDTWVLAYVEPARRRAFVAGLGALAAARGAPVWLVSCESEEVLASLEVGLGQAPADDSGGLSTLSLHRFAPGRQATHRLLATCHAHGRWLRWLEAASAAGPA
ncbi:MAG: DUF2332 domain-containing protein [Candidatus Limnocylindria bacterium]